MKKIIYSSLVFISLFSASCSMQDHVLPGEPDVYISGWETTATNYVAKYWKNGQGVNLFTSERPAMANSIAVSGSDVYAVGFASDPNNVTIGKYWKNGVEENFSKDIDALYLSDVDVSGGDIYVAGVGGNGQTSFAAYWKNGVSVMLPGNGGWAKGITVSGSDVYTAGFTFNGVQQVASYWKNGVRTDLTDGAHYAMATAIAVSGNEVLVVGYEILNGVPVSRYWKNGVELGITSNKEFSDLADITVSNNGIYMVGRESVNALYWHNSIQSLDNGISASGIKVLDNDVYISGTTSNGSNSLAQYWKNGQRVVVSDGTANATATAIYVKKP